MVDVMEIHGQMHNKNILNGFFWEFLWSSTFNNVRNNRRKNKIILKKQKIFVGKKPVYYL